MSIYEVPSVSSGQLAGEQLAVMPPTQVLNISQTLPEEEYLTGIVISKRTDDDNLKPVTRIELLSPANKPPGAHASTYALKRAETLAAGINLVEIDYLHERRSPTSGIPSYPAGEQGTFPYLILINIPSPSLATGRVQLYGFRVDERIPVIAVP